jgi:type II secretory pathway component PulF
MSGNVDLDDLVFFNQHLASIIRTKLPLPEGLSVIARDTQNEELRRALGEMQEDMNAGHSLSEALERRDGTFPDLYASMVKAGEESGDLPGILAELSAYSQARWKLERKVRVALIYPALIGVFILFYVPFLGAFVLPKVSKIYQSTERSLPFMTRLFIACKDVLSSPWSVLFLLGIPLLWVVYRLLYRSRLAKGFVDRWLLSIPLFGTLAKQAELWRFNRTLGILLNAGVSLVRSLKLVRATSQNQVISSAIDRIRQKVSSGERFGDQCIEAGVFPETMTWKISMGEQQGTLEETLMELAEYYDLEVRLTSRKIQSLVGPALLIVLSVVVALVLVSIYQPIFMFSDSVGLPY